MNIKSRAGRRQLQLFNTLWCLNITLLSPRHFSSKSQIEAHCLQIIIYSVEQHFLFIMQLSPHLFSLYNQLNLHMFSYCMIIIGSHIFSHHLCWFRPINPQKNHGNPSIFVGCRSPEASARPGTYCRRSRWPLPRHRRSWRFHENCGITVFECV